MSYNSDLQANNNDLREILDKVNALPDADSSGGVFLPDLGAGAIFKVCRCKESNLPSSLTDGYTYFCTDTGNIYIDWCDKVGIISRKQINANYALKLRYLDKNKNYIDITSAEIHNHLSNKNNPHGLELTDFGITVSVEDINKINSTSSDLKEEIELISKKKAETSIYKGTFLATKWSSTAPYTQVISVPGIVAVSTDVDTPIVDINLSNVSDCESVINAWNNIGRVTVESDNKATGYCYTEHPTVDIPVLFKVVR